MSPPRIGVEGESRGSVSLMAAAQNGLELKERNYLGLPDCSSGDSSSVSSDSEVNKSNLNLKATELRLGLPGSQSPERDSELCQLSSGKLEEKNLFPLLPSKDGVCVQPLKNVVSGNKRGFSDTMSGISEMKGSMYTEGKWMFHAGSESEAPQVTGKFPANAGTNVGLASRASGAQSNIMKEVPSKVLQERPRAANGATHNEIKAPTNNSSAPPAAKAQVVGWPPIRSYRKNTLATTSKNNDEVDGKPGPGTLFVKVSMDGAPYLRKVDLRMYSTYQELSSALEKMFSCFTIGQWGSHATPGKDMLSESKLRDMLHGSDCVLTYEDKDGDWMLVGDVPWDFCTTHIVLRNQFCLNGFDPVDQEPISWMFIESCKRLKIMKSSDAIGLAPRAMEKSKNRI